MVYKIENPTDPVQMFLQALQKILQGKDVNTFIKQLMEKGKVDKFKYLQGSLGPLGTSTKAVEITKDEELKTLLRAYEYLRQKLGEKDAAIAFEGFLKVALGEPQQKIDRSRENSGQPPRIEVDRLSLLERLGLLPKGDFKPHGQEVYAHCVDEVGGVILREYHESEAKLSRETIQRYLAGKDINIGVDQVFSYEDNITFAFKSKDEADRFMAGLRNALGEAFTSIDPHQEKLDDGRVDINIMGDRAVERFAQVVQHVQDNNHPNPETAAPQCMKPGCGSRT